MKVVNIENFKLAHFLNEEYKSILLKENVHFRGSINSLSLISISTEKPELGIKCNVIKYSVGKKIQDLIEQDINKIKTKPIPKRPTPEKILQSWIINYALKNNNQLPFDKDIKFIASEIAIKNNADKKIVTDILGYNERENQLCVIELKSDRLQKRLIAQVNNFVSIINEAPEFFIKLLSIHGLGNPNGLSTKITKVVVWPHEKTSPRKELKAENIVEVTYQGQYTFLKFN